MWNNRRRVNKPFQENLELQREELVKKYVHIYCTHEKVKNYWYYYYHVVIRNQENSVESFNKTLTINVCTSLKNGVSYKSHVFLKSINMLYLLMLKYTLLFFGKDVIS